MRMPRLPKTVASRALGNLLRDPRVPLSACAIVGLLLAGVGWIAVTAVLARNELLAAQRNLETLRGQASAQSAAGPAAQLQTAGTAVRSAARHAARAHRLTTGPAWYPAAHLPLLGEPLRTVRGIAEASDQLTHEVLSPLTRTAAELAAVAGNDGGHLSLIHI